MEILYCFKCQTRLMPADFDRGRALRLENNAACSKCVHDLMAPLSLKDQEALLLEMKEKRLGRAPEEPLPVIPFDDAGAGPAAPPPRPPAKRRLSESSTRVKPLEWKIPRDKPSHGGLKALVGVVLLLLIGWGIYLVYEDEILRMAGLRAPAAPAPFDSAQGKPAPLPPPERPPPASAMKDPHAPAREALQAARAADPRDVPGQVALWEKAVAAAKGTPLHAEASQGLEALQKKLTAAILADLTALDVEIKAACGREEFKAALDLVEKARKRYASLDWTLAIDRKIQEVGSQARNVYFPLREKAAEAKSRGDAAEIASIRARVAKWALADLAGDLEKALAGAPASVEPGPAPAVKPAEADPKGAKATAYGQRWERAALLAGARDYAAAAKEVEEASAAQPDAESAGDLETVRAASAVHQEALQILAKWPRGHNLVGAYTDETGAVREFDEPVVRVEPPRLYLRQERGAAVVEFGEILAGTLADLTAGRPGRKPEDGRAAAAFCLFEGDLEAAKRLGGEGLPEKLVRHARRLAERRADPREQEARGLFAAADAEFRGYPTRADAMPKYRKLLAEFGDTAFVRRNRASIQGRTDAGKEYFFAPADFTASGVFRLARHAKGEVGWTAEDDVDPARRHGNYVEIEFAALPDSDYKAWVYAGGCCKETFTFYAQGTELMGPDPINPQAIVPVDPGSAHMVRVEHAIPFLKTTHSAHGGGRKEPSRWEWIPVALPKYSAGPKKVRFLTDQQGYSVGYALVSSARKAPPREVEVAELEKTRPEIPAALLAPENAASVGTVLREYWLNLTGNQVTALTSQPAYPGRPSGSGYLASLEGPSSWGDQYGARLRGYVHPPVTGAYHFFISGDEDAELWLSPDESPSTKGMVTGQFPATKPREYERHAAQKSRAITLVAGRRYYFEVLHKEAGGDDHVSVGWQLPDGSLERPLPGRRLSPFLTGAQNVPVVSITLPAEGSLFPAGANITVTGGVHGGAGASRVEVFQGGTKLGDGRGTPFTYTWPAVPPGSYTFLARATDKSGAAVTSPPVNVRVGDVSFCRGVNLNGYAVTVDGNAWQGRDAPNLKKTGLGLELRDVELKPGCDADRAAMIRSCVRAKEGTRVSLTSVPAGTYQVYLYVWDPGDPQTFDLTLNGATVETGRSTGPAGRWERLGPWGVDVKDGTIDVAAARGAPCFSGIEVWKVGK